MLCFNGQVPTFNYFCFTVNCFLGRGCFVVVIVAHFYFPIGHNAKLQGCFSNFLTYYFKIPRQNVKCLYALLHGACIKWLKKHDNCRRNHFENLFTEMLQVDWMIPKMVLNTTRSKLPLTLYVIIPPQSQKIQSVSIAVSSFQKIAKSILALTTIDFFITLVKIKIFNPFHQDHHHHRTYNKLLLLFFRDPPFKHPPFPPPPPPPARTPTGITFFAKN